MEYAVIVNNRSFDLPKKTLSVVEKIDAILKMDTTKGLSIRQKFEKLHVFVKEMVGEENAEEALGSSNLSEIDLSEVVLAVKKIIDAYEKPITDYDNKKQMEMFDSIPIDKIVSMTKAAQSVANVQMMKK